MLPFFARLAPNQGGLVDGASQGLGPLQLAPLPRGGQAGVRRVVEVVRNGVVLCDGAQVRALGELSGLREGGDVFGAGGEGVRARKGSVDGGEVGRRFVDVAHRGRGARAPPFAATTASAGRPSQGIAARCNRRLPFRPGCDSGTLF